MTQVTFLDNLLEEYLIFRGLPNTLKAFNVERKHDKNQSHNVEKVVEQFNQAIRQYDIQGLLTLWKHLDTNIYSKLDYNYATVVKKLESGLLKLYLINAYNHNMTEKITEFFNEYAGDIQPQSDWRDWLYFPFCRKPEEHPTFSMYFTKQWHDTFQLSLRNFLSVVYQCLPQPTFVHAEKEAFLIRYLQEENALLKYRLQQSLQKQMTKVPASESTSRDSGDHSRRHRIDDILKNLNDITPFNSGTPNHVADDFCIIASEVNNITQVFAKLLLLLDAFIKLMRCCKVFVHIGSNQLSIIPSIKWFSCFVLCIQNYVYRNTP